MFLIKSTDYAIKQNICEGWVEDGHNYFSSIFLIPACPMQGHWGLETTHPWQEITHDGAPTPTSQQSPFMTAG